MATSSSPTEVNIIEDAWQFIIGPAILAVPLSHFFVTTSERKSPGCRHDPAPSSPSYIVWKNLEIAHWLIHGDVSFQYFQQPERSTCRELFFRLHSGVGHAV
ncbi:hypothetical protein J6590_045158 [Homalodisca vitripennis]|nr:hypothetical protein J6590_045158 [Homalodisca vitripennis]